MAGTSQRISDRRAIQQSGAIRHRGATDHDQQGQKGSRERQSRTRSGAHQNTYSFERARSHQALGMDPTAILSWRVKPAQAAPNHKKAIVKTAVPPAGSRATIAVRRVGKDVAVAIDNRDGERQRAVGASAAQGHRREQRGPWQDVPAAPRRSRATAWSLEDRPPRPADWYQSA